MKTKKVAYPCTNCKRKDMTHNACLKWEEWFKCEWREIRRKFGKDLK